LIGCEGPAPEPEALVDPIVWDSIQGLQEGDRVHVLDVHFGSDGEVVEPDSLLVEAGDWVDFRSSDGSPRLISFVLDSMAPGNRGFLQEIGARSSPPLVADGSHWVVSFQQAPPGVYPFIVEGARAPARGVIHVADPG
jgi:hypothetical protein